MESREIFCKGFIFWNPFLDSCFWEIFCREIFSWGLIGVVQFEVALQKSTNSPSNLSNRFLKRLLATRVSSHSTTSAVARCSKALMVMSFRLPSGVGISVSTEVAIA